RRAAQPVGSASLSGPARARPGGRRRHAAARLHPRDRRRHRPDGQRRPVSAEREEIAHLHRELEETNRGLIALYAELEDARQAEARLAAIVQASDDAMFSVTPDRVIDSWNPGAQRLLGYEPSEVVGRPVELLIPEHLHREALEALERLGRG